MVGYIHKKRLFNTLKLLEGRNHYQRILDVGYGSGILFPELSSRAKQVYGLEVHEKESLVSRMLEKEGVANVFLKRGTILEMPFKDSYFDAVVSVSTLEHIKDLDRAICEIKRILKPAGRVVLSFPVRNAATDFCFRLLGYKPREIHPSSHSDIIAAAKRHFKIEEILKFPNFSNIDYSLYCSIKCRRA